jgi:hypothetical protein
MSKLPDVTEIGEAGKTLKTPSDIQLSTAGGEIQNSQGDNIFAQTFYVDTGGSDTADGSIGSPLATIAEAVSRQASGKITINLTGDQTHTLSAHLIIRDTSVSFAKNGGTANPIIDFNGYTFKIYGIGVHSFYQITLNAHVGGAGSTLGMFVFYYSNITMSLWSCNVVGDGTNGRVIFNSYYNSSPTILLKSAVFTGGGSAVVTYSTDKASVITFNDNLSTWTNYAEPSMKTIL